MFHDYLNGFPTEKMRKALKELFVMLNTPDEERDPYDPEDLRAFPYVNGGLFANEEIEIPNFTDEIREILLSKASDGFDWSDISPTIFGAVFESTLNPETRRRGGMHYTSIENIHKVIDPLFLDDLKTEYKEIKSISVINTRKTKLEAFQDKLASLTWLDPAAGSGNFLTETFLCIRELENQVIRGILDCKKGSVEGQIILDVTNPIKVSINQFYGIEINDFAVTVAKTALWIAESQMIKKTEDIVHRNIDFLPLKTNANIIEGNALRINWEDVVSKHKLNYIMGNPPFVGYAYQSPEQKKDLMMVVGHDSKNIDYVSGWYYVAASLIKDTKIKVAFVSTNSITQGEQVAAVWKDLYERYKINIFFAHRTFRWDSEASLKAHVHCVIIGFECGENTRTKCLYSSEGVVDAKLINFYLVNGPIVFLEKRTKPICDVTEIIRGSSPNDDGNLLMDEVEYSMYIKDEPQGVQFVRPFMMGKDFINRKPRYCFWLVSANPSELKKCPLLLKRIEAVKQFRLKSKRKKTLELANTPTMFEDMRISDKRYIAIPKVSSETRRYIPMDYLDSSIIPGDKLFFMKNSTLYDFGILNSNVHMAWMRAVAGRLEMRYSYSNTIVYNNFPWPASTDEQRDKISKTAQGILNARNLYPDSSLADLYDPLTMPVELIKAHQANDRAVMEAYGFNVGTMSEEDCVAELMKMYQELTKTEG